jgi:hypothetical protein
MRRNPDRRTRGATILDLLVGIGLTAIVLGAAIPNFRALTEPYVLDTASRVVATDMKTARMRAIAQNRRHRVFFNDDAGWWEVQAETAPGTFTTVGARRTLPTGAAFGTIATNPIFDTRGMMAANFSLDVQNPHGKRTVAVNVLGDTTVGHTEAVEEAGAPAQL